MSSETTTNKRKFSGGDKKSHFFKKQHKNQLVSGHRGFLATCNFREKQCTRDCLKLLNQYADEMYTDSDDHKPDEENKEDIADTNKNSDDDTDANGAEYEDIATSLQKEIDRNKTANANKKVLRFHQVDTGVSNCQFIRTTLRDPVAIAERIVQDIDKNRTQVSRFILRFIPVEITCKATLEDIVNGAGRLFDKYFLNGPAVTFSIVFNRRYNNDLGRDKIYQELADLVKFKNVNHRVDLKNPEKTVIVEVIKGLCCISVVSNYLKLKKYNLLELALQKNPKTDNEPIVPKESASNAEPNVETPSDDAPKTEDNEKN